MTSPKTEGLSKDERLHGKTAVAVLLEKGRWASYGHFRYCYRDGNGQGFCRIIAGVPKKHFKRAVKRNLLKRRIREAFRTQKHLVEGRQTDILFSYNSDVVLSSQEIFAEIGEILRKLC